MRKKPSHQRHSPSPSRRRHRPRPAAIEPLETRWLLSTVIQSLTPILPTTTQVQSPVQYVPTYHVLTNGLTHFQTSGPQGFTPAQIRNAYGLNQVTFGNITGDGAGQTIAIIDAYNDPTIQADLHAFDQAFGLADPSLRVVSQSGSTHLPPVDPSGAGTNNWEGEEALDVEWAHAMAPGASIILVEANDASPGNLFAAVNWARAQAGVSVVSMSFGGNETSTETQFDSTFTTPTGHQGVTFVASTGDSGAPAGYPALSPNVVAAGGTSLSLDSLGNYVSETGWSGSGGGASNVESMPSYQNGVVTQSGGFRANPDVAFDADPSTGVAIYDSYNNGTGTPWEVIGGTSVAAPAWAGIFAVADQGRVLAGMGTLNSRSDTLPMLYAAPAALFHDITTGNNGFSAGPGYDLVTGRGSPKINLLVPYLVTGTITVSTQSGATISSIIADNTTVTEGNSLTLTAEGVSDPGATGVTVTFYEETNGVAGLQTDPNTGDFAFTAVTDGSNAITLDTTSATPGTYTFYAQVTDDAGGATPIGTNAPSITVTIVAPSNSGPSIAAIAATPSPIVSGDTLTLTAQGLNDPIANVRRVFFYEETNGIPGLQTGPGGDLGFRGVGAFSGFAIQLDTTGVTGNVTFYAQAVDDLGNISPDGPAAPSVTVNIMSDTVPNSPTTLTATAASPTEVDLSFSEVDSGQTGFTIERAQDPNFTNFTRLFTINRANAQSYSDTGLAGNIRYYYRVDAFNAAGDSAFSNTASALTPLPATRLVIIQQPKNTIAGQSINSISVNIEDSLGHTITADNSSVTIALSGNTTSTLDGTLTESAVAGVATFGDLSMTAAGRYTLVATDLGLAAAHSNTFTITPDTSSAQLALVQISGSGSGVVGQRLHPSPTIAVQDQFANRIASNSSPVTITLLTGPGTLSGSTTINAFAGVASFSNLRLNQTGAYTLQAADSSLPVTTPVSFNETINPAVTTLHAPFNSWTYTFGQTLNFTSNLHSTAPNSIPFTGNLTLTDNTGDLLATAPLNNSGQARFILHALTAGTYTAILNYAGDTNHTAATSSTFTIQVSQAGTSTSLHPSASQLVAGQPLTLTAHVSASAAAPRTGNITFMEGATTLGTIALDASSNAALTLSNPTLGNHNYTAVYSGDPDFKTSTSFTTAITVQRDRTSLTLASSILSPLLPGQSFNLTATLAIIPPGTGTPTGTITFKDGGRTLGTATLGTDGTATLTTTLASAGSHSLTALYLGDTSDLPSTSQPVVQTIT